MKNGGNSMRYYCICNIKSNSTLADFEISGSEKGETWVYGYEEGRTALFTDKKQAEAINAYFNNEYEVLKWGQKMRKEEGK